MLGSESVHPQIHLWKLSLLSLIKQWVLTPADWLPVGLASGRHWPEGGRWGLFYSLTPVSIRHVCPGSSFHRETPAPGLLKS